MGEFVLSISLFFYLTFTFERYTNTEKIFGFRVFLVRMKMDA